MNFENEINQKYWEQNELKNRIIMWCTKDIYHEISGWSK